MSRKNDIASILYKALVQQGQTGVYAMELIADYNQEIVNEFYAQYLEQPKTKQSENFVIELGKYTPSETPHIEWYQVTKDKVSIGGIQWQDRYCIKIPFNDRKVASEVLAKIGQMLQTLVEIKKCS